MHYRGVLVWIWEGDVLRRALLYNEFDNPGVEDRQGKNSGCPDLHFTPSM